MKMTQELLRNLIREELSKNLPASTGEENLEEFIGSKAKMNRAIKDDAAGGESSGERGKMTSSDFRRYLFDFVRRLASAKNLTDIERGTMASGLEALFSGAQQKDISNDPQFRKGLGFIKTAAALSEQEEVCEKCGKSPCECDETEESIEQAISANKNDVTITRFKESKEDLDELIKEIILSTITNK